MHTLFTARSKCFQIMIFIVLMWRNPYPAGSESDLPLPPSMQSDQSLYCWLTKLHVLILISLKMIMDSSKNRRWIIPSKNERWIIPFKKFSRVMVKIQSKNKFCHICQRSNNLPLIQKQDSRILLSTALDSHTC